MTNEIQPNTKLPKTKKIRVYTALLQQSGTSAPTVTVLQNDLGEEVTWEREDVGRYNAICSEFKFGKTAGYITGYYPTSTYAIQDNTDGDPKTMTLVTSHYNAGTGALDPSDNKLYQSMIEIRIYE